ncbi:hypothetical protein ACFYS8_20805 [Kitasatospora sp. NPDC004615]|uniref:hypothetical protein n=1 Tax=Kitasatospora sp. NPDC004615 TaxID=3364017 RepID=UPI0036BB51E0
MTELAVLARLSDDADHPVERLTCHPRLPLAVGTATEGRTVRVYDCGEGQLRELASLDVEPGSTPWGEDAPPAVAWHPEEPLLLVADGESLLRWSPDGPSDPVRLPAAAAYEVLAFSPDGRHLWATPSAEDEWAGSDVLDPATGAVTGPARPWDTGVATHPSGALVATLASDQGATFCLFAQPDGGAMRVQRHTLVLDCDGYGTPLFSPDGRLFAIRGNAYTESVDVFAFPSLRRVLRTSFQEPESGGEWSRHNLAFGAAPGLLWIGTPNGTLLELDVEARSDVEHDLRLGAPLTALAATANGELLLALDSGELVLLSALHDPAPATGSAAEDVASFLAATEEAPEDSDLLLTDGTRTWTDDDLTTVTEASPADPTWLQIQANMNQFRGAQTP